MNRSARAAGSGRFHRLLVLTRRGRAATPTSRWRWLRLALTLACFLVFGAFLVAGMREVDWQETGRALLRYDRASVLSGVVLALLGYGAAASYELLGRRYERHHLSPTTTGLIGFVAYGFSMNLGAMMGGWLVRYRLYRRRGLGTPRIARIIGIGVLSNWSGYLLLAGLVFSLQPPAPPPDWPVHADALRGLGLGLLAACGAYLYLCAHHEGRSWTLRGVALRCPPLDFALLQLAVSSLSWLLMAAVIANFLPDEIGYLTVLAVLCLSSIAGLVIRMPAGLGVVEAVFVAVLAHRIGSPGVIAALVAFRASYYLFPFLLALVVYLLLEARGRGRTKAAEREPPKRLPARLERSGQSTAGGIQSV